MLRWVTDAAGTLELEPLPNERAVADAVSGKPIAFDGIQCEVETYHGETRLFMFHSARAGSPGDGYKP
jgi:hypothetical protein